LSGRKKILVIGVIGGILIIIAVSMLFIPITKIVNTELGNPASKYCLDHGGSSLLQTLTAINGSESQEGICEFHDGSQCEEWKFFRGECKPRS
jgi:inhibitor of cysteine peptidase